MCAFLGPNIQSSILFGIFLKILPGVDGANNNLTPPFISFTQANIRSPLSQTGLKLQQLSKEIPISRDLTCDSLKTVNSVECRLS